MLIESIKNPKIKNILLLEAKKKERQNQNSFIVEGLQENHWALNAKFIAKEFYVCDEIFNNQILLPEGVKLFFISKKVFESLSYRKSTGGIIGIYELSSTNLNEIKLKKNPLIVIVDSIEKPGNLGAILRSAEASGVDAVLLSDSLIDVFNSNVIRSSVGTLFLNQVVADSSINIQNWLKNNNILSYATFLSDEAKSMYLFDFAKPTAFVFGTESTGLKANWLDFCDQKIIIPMQGKIDSLNVSNATAICLFESNRQRNYLK